MDLEDYWGGRYIFASHVALLQSLNKMTLYVWHDTLGFKLSVAGGLLHII